MRKFCCYISALFFTFCASAQVKINEVYGGGGNSGSTWTNDFIELYNPTGSPVSLAGWSVQYASVTGTTWQVTNLSGSIAANGYYLIQQAQGAGGTTPLPTPDATGTIPMGGSSGKVILCNVITAQSGTNPINANIIDKVGYGSSANGYEGTGPAPGTSNSSSVERSSPGFDTDNNNTDFILITPPTPTNSGYDIIPPAISSLYPAHMSTGIAPAFQASVTFTEAVQKGTGNILLKKYSDNSIIATIDVTTAAVTVSGSTASFLIQSLPFSNSFYFEISAGAFKDNANNNFPGFTGNTTWLFTTTAQPAGAIGTTYNFNSCSGYINSGFTQYSVIGDQQLWLCTTFGRDPSNPSASLANGMQINGFSGTNIPNEDWLISPAFDLSSASYPLLSFWSRTKFNGLPLQLKVSTNYPGYGNPHNFSWTDLNGKFPAQISDIWTESGNINLSAFKTAGVYFAFVYFSSVDEGARWTLDDILITNSVSPPPSSITVSTPDLQFGYASAGGNITKTFTVTGNDITGDITLTSSPGSFTLADNPGGPFTSSLVLALAASNNITRAVYAKFSPAQNNLNFSGTINIASPGVSSIPVQLQGTSMDPANTLEVVNWNIEWFGSPDNGPANDALQQANVQTILQNIGADIYGLLEVVDESRLASVVANMPGYAYVISNYGSHTNTSANPPSNLASAQKLAYVYKTSVFSTVTTEPLLSQGINSAADITNPAYNYFASGRFPYMLTANATMNGVTQLIRFVLIHGKANTSPTTTSYNRRKSGSDTLHQTLNTLYPNDKIIFLGDYNDDLDSTITDGIIPRITSYVAFTNDPTNYLSTTLPLSLAGKTSTVSFNDVIDHAVISNEMQCYYMNNSASILTDVVSMVSNFGSTTSDHYPVFTRYSFSQGPAATISYPGNPFCISNGTAAVTQTGTSGGIYSSDPGLTLNASSGEITPGSSTPGIYTVTYTIPAGNGCSAFSTTAPVTINALPTVNCPSNLSVLITDPAMALTGGSPAGGTYSGTGVSAGYFNPALSGPGNFIITYTYNDLLTLCANNCTFSISVSAAPLTNDNASGAIELIVGSGCTGSPYTNAGATQSAGEPFAACKGTTGYRTVWYKFIAPASGNVRVSTDYSGGTLGSDTRIALFSAEDVNNYATFSNLVCDDDNGTAVASRSILYAAALTGGNTYYIQVDGKDGSTATGTFCITVDEITSAMISASVACVPGRPLNSVNDNYTGWLSATDINGKLLALISNPAGGVTTSTSTYNYALHINSGPVRQDANGSYYLDRNYMISNASVSNVNVQFFFLNTELAALQAADPAVTISGLQVTRQTGTVCDNNFTAPNGTNSSVTQTGNGTGSGFSWIRIQTPGLSKFYLHTRRAYAPVKTFLQGAYSSGLSRHKDVNSTWASIMNTNALNQPFNISPFNYSGTESVSPGFFTSTATVTDIVDWVLVEIRDAAVPSTVIGRRAAFLREDGLIKDLNGISDLSFRTLANGNYHIVIRHRNHLAIRTATPVTLEGTLGFTASLKNFSTSQAEAYQNITVPPIPVNPAQKDLTGGIFGMWGGNANGDGSVRASGPLSTNDYLFLLTTTLGGNVANILLSIYSKADMNLDGSVRASGPLATNDYLFLITTVLGGDATKLLLQHQ